VDQCFTLAKRGGKFGQIGTTVHPKTVDFMRIAYKELKVYGSYGSSLVTRRRALRVLEMGRFNLTGSPLTPFLYPSGERLLGCWKAGKG
jgi:L-iditol 2-dehydrogenase